MQRLAIVIRDDSYDKLYTPLTFAWLAARRGIEVDILFVLWAVRMLTTDGARGARMSPAHATDEHWFRERVLRDGDPLALDQFLQLVKGAGSVRLYACKLAAATFDVAPDALLPEAEGIVDALWFLEEKACKADHCQYF